MSKVYSFRLSDDNPREAQAREVIEAWGEEGYSLRHKITEALLMLNNMDVEGEHQEISYFLDQLQEIIQSIRFENSDTNHDSKISRNFKTAIINSVKSGLEFSEK